MMWTVLSIRGTARQSHASCQSYLCRRTRPIVELFLLLESARHDLDMIRIPRIEVSPSTLSLFNDVRKETREYVKIGTGLPRQHTPRNLGRC